MDQDDFLVARDNLSRTSWLQRPLVSPARGEVLVTVDRFALTANNITYATLGDEFHYWDFFPAPAGLGRIPVWGLGTILESRVPGLIVGERVYGYFPMSSHRVLTPAAVRTKGFVDAAPHRQTQPATYNEYACVDRDPNYDTADDDIHLVLRPLFSLAFFLNAFLRERAFFGASTIIVSSASSKASLAIGLLLRDGGPTIVGLTSDTNLAFVRSTAIFNRVVAYGDLEELEREPSVYIDMAGNLDVLRRIHAHFDDLLRHSSRAGFTHAASASGDGLAGPKPEAFFTPTHILALRRLWGPELLRKRLLDSRQNVFRKIGSLLTMRCGVGRTAVEGAYDEVRTGRVAPQEAWLLAVSPPV